MLASYAVLLPGSDLSAGLVLTAYMALLLAGIYALVLSQFPATIAARRLGREAAATHGAPPAGSWGGGMLAVAPQFRKKLIGDTTVAVALLRELERIAREAGVTEMWAPTSSPDAARLYARLGGEKLAGFEWRGKEWSLWRLTIDAPLVIDEQQAVAAHQGNDPQTGAGVQVHVGSGDAP